MVPVYSFSWAMNSFILLVNLPVQMINKPVANGSSVPACPTFFILIKLRNFLTASNEVQRRGLLIKRTWPSAKSAPGREDLGSSFLFNSFVIIVVAKKQLKNGMLAACVFRLSLL